jgi:hypothetical protein
MRLVAPGWQNKIMEARRYTLEAVAISIIATVLVLVILLASLKFG